MNKRLSVEHLSKKFADKTALDDVSLHVDSGEIVGLLGPNGAGKTTCFYAVVGLLHAEHGKIQMNGRDMTDLPIHKRAQLGLAYLAQEKSIFADLTAAENVQAILEIVADHPPAENRELALKLLEDLGVAHLADTRAAHLSGGEQRRVEIARLLAIQPSFVLLDEPFAAIAPIAVKELQKIIFSLRNNNIGIFITDHNVRETLNICDRAYILDGGQILTEGKPDTIIADENARRVYLGRDFGI